MNSWRIVIAERGWVFAGKVQRDGDRVAISDCYTVRRFSLETNGLAAREGMVEADVADLTMLALGDSP